MPRVLVVDDDALLCTLVAETRVDVGYQVETATNGREALARAAAQRSDVITLDRMMPIMDGWTFLAERRTVPALAPVPVIALSAARRVAELASEDLGSVQAVSKPCDLIALLSTVAATAAA